MHIRVMHAYACIYPPFIVVPPPLIVPGPGGLKKVFGSCLDFFLWTFLLSIPPYCLVGGPGMKAGGQQGGGVWTYKPHGVRLSGTPLEGIFDKKL